MPADAFTRKANTPKRKRQWGHVRSSMLKRGASKKSAIMAANAAMKRSHRKARRSRRK